MTSSPRSSTSSSTDRRPRPRARLRPTLPTGLTLAVAAGALVLTATGGAVAGTLITGAQVKNGTLTSADVKDRSLRTADLAPKAVARLRGKQGPKGQAGAPGTARGYAHIVGANVSRQSGGITVTNPFVGTYCVTVPGVDPNTGPAVVSLDYAHSSTSTEPNAPQGAVEVATLACPNGTFGVRTFIRTFPDANTTVLQNANQGFTILVP
ncbi:hypothetical protein [Nocardioides lijunqiniae]|uniref:hypothetical protein n=1 Tax=Nocardioides lijunqiniae TaxID=2760832 RepID=UPI001878B944|nr:hypothetical protein [Nocardioides lijunqiniae]